jgi:hypothetical protein
MINELSIDEIKLKIKESQLDQVYKEQFLLGGSETLENLKRIADAINLTWYEQVYKKAKLSQEEMFSKIIEIYSPERLGQSLFRVVFYVLVDDEIKLAYYKYKKG